MSFDLESYRERAERFGEELSREYYRHLAGHKPELEIEGIYDSYGDLFARDSVMALRDLADSADGGDEGRRLSYLLHFAFDGLVGMETRGEAAELAGLEASLEVDAGDGPMPYRAVVIAQANEVDAERREALEVARNAVLEERLNPIYGRVLQRAHEICRRVRLAELRRRVRRAAGDRPGAGCASRPGGSSRRPRSGMGRCWTTSSSAPRFPA